MGSLFACLSDLHQDNLNSIYDLPPTVSPQEIFNLLCKRFSEQGHISTNNIIYDTSSNSLFIISKYGQAILTKSSILDFSGEYPTEILYAHPDFFNPFDYLANELQLKEPSQSYLLSSVIEKCKSYNSSPEVRYVEYSDIPNTLLCASKCLSRNAQNSYGLITTNPDDELLFYHIFTSEYPTESHVIQYKINSQSKVDSQSPLTSFRIDSSGQIRGEVRPIYDMGTLQHYNRDALHAYNKIYSNYVHCVKSNSHNLMDVDLLTNEGDFIIIKTQDEESVYLLLELWFDKPMYAKLSLQQFKNILLNKSPIINDYKSYMLWSPEVTFVIIPDTITQQEYFIRRGTLNLGTKQNLLETLATGKSYKGIYISSDPDYDDINHFLIYEGHHNEANFAGELVLKQSNTSIQVNDITVYTNGKGITLKVLLLLFSLGATEITGESETSAESYWEQYVPLQNPSPAGYKTFTITQYDVLNSPLYIKYKEIANL